MVLEKLEGGYIDDYNRLEAYAQELRDSNPGTYVVINISKDALEEGKKRFPRMVEVGLDGIFLKGKCKGILLVAMAQDSAKHFYPLAWAVIDRETELGDVEGVAFISDMQKGLIDVVATVVPKSHHRWCVRHIEANWSKNWRGAEMKKLLWWCAWSSYDEEFKDQLRTLGTISEQAAKELIWYPPQNWCRAYFDTTCKNQMVDNNFTESFNKWILEAGHKPIIKMLEDIRVKVMKMLKDREDECRTWRDEFTPYVMELLGDFREIAQGCEVDFNSNFGYKVHEGPEKHTVNFQLKKCTCRTWDLTEIPCPHAIRCLIDKKEEPLSEMHWWYSKEAYMDVYMHKIQPVRGEKLWKVEPHHAMEPLEIVKMVGRPKVKGKHSHFFQEEGSSQEVQDVPLTAPQDSQTSEFVFVPTLGMRPMTTTQDVSFKERKCW
ncbi:PREDICTED: uncharacterized protein LOC109207023 [Nicotiana attenuata]|uniref:uncharacterized protein LOC109207023 n=1 Tax=Nicotiana attenuata TaxID=49451 RepID=UPI00090561BD|nr:PREDICTED: uncharacterized protein LOC109207023 [Nicotiana attenuata]